MKTGMLIVTLFLLAGCTYNSAPLHLYMRDGEFQRAAAERFCIGMSEPEARVALDEADLDYRTMSIDVPEVDIQRTHIMAFLRKAGVSIDDDRRASGRFNLWFEEGQLVSVSYQHPLDSSSFELAEPVAIDLPACDESEEARAAP